MKGSPKNLHRDGMWIKPRTLSNLSWGTQTAFGTTQLLANADPSTYDNQAQAHAYDANFGLTNGNVKVIGCYMKEPTGDNTPYRVIAGQEIVGQYDVIYSSFLVVGYAPASPTGTDDTIDQVFLIPFVSEFDGLLVVPPLDDSDANYGRALFIGVGVACDANLSSQDIMACISVQRLATTPPTLAASTA